MQPPLLPDETLSRVLRLARSDGLGVLIVATFFALTSAAIGDFTGAVVWLLVAGAGAGELHGGVLLREAEARGLNWIVASQFLLLFVVAVHCALRLTHYDANLMHDALTPEMKATLAEASMKEDDFLRLVYNTTYTAIAGAALLYKGGLALYFHRRRPAVAAALQD
jgi:hypothetical protein